MAFLKKNWFFVGIAVMIILAYLLPGLGRWVREFSILNVGIFLAFFVTGLTLETSSIGSHLRQFKAPVFAMISSLLLLPLLAWFLARMVLSPEFVIGVCIIATAPVTVASGTVMTAIGRGNVPLSLFICVLGNFLAIFTIPVSLSYLVSIGSNIDLPVFKMLSGLLLTVLVPTLLGQLVRPLVKEKLPPLQEGIFLVSAVCCIADYLQCGCKFNRPHSSGRLDDYSRACVYDCPSFARSGHELWYLKGHWAGPRFNSCIYHSCFAKDIDGFVSCLGWLFCCSVSNGTHSGDWISLDADDYGYSGRREVQNCCREG